MTSKTLFLALAAQTTVFSFVEVKKYATNFPNNRQSENHPISHSLTLFPIRSNSSKLHISIFLNATALLQTTSEKRPNTSPSGLSATSQKRAVLSTLPKNPFSERKALPSVADFPRSLSISQHDLLPTTPPQPSHRNGELPRQHLRHRSRQSKLLILLQDRRLPTRGPLLAQTRQALLQPNHPPPKPVPEPGLRPEEQDECEPAAEPL